MQARLQLGACLRMEAAARACWHSLPVCATRRVLAEGSEILRASGVVAGLNKGACVGIRGGGASSLRHNLHASSGEVG